MMIFFLPMATLIFILISIQFGVLFGRDYVWCLSNECFVIFFTELPEIGQRISSR